MSTRYEFFDAPRTTIELWTRDQVEDETGEDLPAGQYGLTIGFDEVAVIAGTVTDLRELVARITTHLDRVDPAPVLPELPAPADEADEVEAFCPHVYTEADAEAVRQANARNVAQMRAMHGDAANIYETPVPEVGTVCGADLQLWDKDPQYGYLYTQGGRWICGPRKGGDNYGGDEEVQCSMGHEWAVPEIDEWQ